MVAWTVELPSVPRLTEFFADFGTYDVKVTLPKDYVIGATGVQVSDQDNGNGTKTVGFHAEDVHDFAWTADPNFKVINETFNGSVGAVKIRLLSYDSHEREWQPYIYCVTIQHEEALTNGMGRIPTRSSPWSIRRMGRRKRAAWNIPRSLPATAAGTFRQGRSPDRPGHRARVRSPVLVWHGGHQRIREWLAG